MKRYITYPGAIPRAADFLGAQQSVMVALGQIMGVVLGVNVVGNGFAVTPTSPASMRVNVGAGSLTQYGVVESTPFGSLPADTTDLTVKMGIATPQVMGPIGTPTVAGQQQNWLIQAQFQETDTGLLVLPYFNANNPLQGYSGPGNQGISQYTVRDQTVVLSLKPGQPATGGSQTTPSADPGWIPIAIINTAYGQTQLNAGSITPHPQAPQPPIPLPAMPNYFRQRLQGNLNLYVSSLGNDTNPGTQAAPFQTLQRAWNYIAGTLDLSGGFSINVNVAAGTYAGVNCIGMPPGFTSGQSINFIGAGQNQSYIAAQNANCFNANLGAQINVSGFTLTASGTAGTYVSVGFALAAGIGSYIAFSNVNFGACGSGHLFSSGGYVSSNGNPYTISGGTPSHLYAAFGGQVVPVNSVVTITGTPNFNIFANCTLNSLINAYSVQWNGAATGARFQVTTGGVISTNGAGQSYFPGNLTGYIETTTYGIYT